MRFETRDSVEPRSKFEPSLKVVDVPSRDTFIIKDEIKSGRSKFEKKGEATGIIKRVNDGKLFQKTFKEKEIEGFVGAFGEDSSEWIGKKIEIKRYFSKNWNKEGLWAEPIFDLDESF
jgi:hypothetical protein